MSAVAELLSLANREDPLRPPAGLDFAQLQLEAADERLQQQRPLIPVLDQRCTAAGVDRIKSREDLIPLLLSHSTYKSYPESFVEKGQWDRMCLWLQTVFTPTFSDVDVTGVSDIDDWLARLRSRGYEMLATSGTSGKHSFLVLPPDDLDAMLDMNIVMFGYPRRPPRLRDRPVTAMVPRRAYMRAAFGLRAHERAFARPGQLHALSERPVRLADSMAATRLRRALADGTATPAEIARAQQAETAQRAIVDEEIERIADLILDYRDEPQIVVAYWTVAWRIMQIARERGVPDGSFHPDSIFLIAGGLKGAPLPGDYQEQMAEFLGPVNRPQVYSMSELSTLCPMCEHGVYHVAPWMTLLVLDETGERLLEPGPDGWVTGRSAFYDPMWTSRWGGLIAGDQITAAYTYACECGRPGPVIADSVTRYSELSAGGDDKITCSGAIEQYVRGAVGGGSEELS